MDSKSTSLPGEPVNTSATKNAEFKEWKWIDVNQLLNVVVEFKLDVYKTIVKELNILLN